MVIGRGYFFCLPVHTVKNVTSACRLMVKGLIIIIITIIIHLLRGGLHQRKRFSGGPLVENIETNTGNFKNLLDQRLRMSNKKISRNYYLGSRKRFPCSHSPILTREGQENLFVCRELCQPLGSLYQAMQIQGKSLLLLL